MSDEELIRFRSLAFKVARLKCIPLQDQDDFVQRATEWILRGCKKSIALLRAARDDLSHSRRKELPTPTDPENLTDLSVYTDFDAVDERIDLYRAIDKLPEQQKYAALMAIENGGCNKADSISLIQAGLHSSRNANGCMHRAAKALRRMMDR